MEAIIAYELCIFMYLCIMYVLCVFSSPPSICTSIKEYVDIQIWEFLDCFKISLFTYLVHFRGSPHT